MSVEKESHFLVFPSCEVCHFKLKCNMICCENVIKLNTGFSIRQHTVMNKNSELNCFLLSDDRCLCFRLLSQLSEKETEYQELLRNSVQRKQKQIDSLRKAANTKGKVYKSDFIFI